MALKLGIQTYPILTNDGEVCISSFSSILLAVCKQKFMFSKKSPQKIDNYVVFKCQIDSEDFVNFYGLLIKHELQEKFLQKPLLDKKKLIDVINDGQTFFLLGSWYKDWL